MASRRFIGYPTDSLMAVLPDAASAAERRPPSGRWDPGPGHHDPAGREGADRLDGTGAVNGVMARLRRLVSFTVMDQLVDMALYEQAVRDGQAS